MKSWRQTDSFEPVDEIVGEQQEMEIELIGLETVGRNLGQSITFFQLPDSDFDCCPGSIKTPNLLCSEREIGDKDLITVTLQSEKCQLFGVFFGKGTTDDDKTMGLLPPERLVEKFGYSPVLPEALITKISYFVF